MAPAIARLIALSQFTWAEPPKANGRTAPATTSNVMNVATITATTPVKRLRRIATISSAVPSMAYSRIGICQHRYRNPVIVPVLRLHCGGCE